MNPSKTHTQLSNDPHQPCTLSHILSRIDLSSKTICEAVCAICKHRHALKHTYKHTHSCRVSLETHSNVPEKFAKASQAKPDLNLQIITFFVASSFPSPLHVPSICLSPCRRIRVSPLQSLFSPSGKTEYCHHFPGGASCQEANYHC